MFALGYFASAGLYGLAGVKAFQSHSTFITAVQLETGVNHKPSEKTAYVALQCIGTPVSSPWFPTDQKVLAGRYTIMKTTPYVDVGAGVTNHDAQNKEYSISLPKELYLSSGNQDVIVHHLDLAKWVGNHQKTTLHSPQNAGILLNEIDVKPDLTTKYQLTANWFEDQQITLFAQAVTIENRIYLQQPQNGYPFIATSMPPKAYADSVRERALTLKEDAKRMTLRATLIGSAAHAYRWMPFKKAYACFVIPAIAGDALLHLRK